MPETRPSSTAAGAVGQPQTISGYCILAPDGKTLVIPKKVFEALSSFMNGDKPAGSVEIHFRNGCVYEVTANYSCRIR